MAWTPIRNFRRARYGASATDIQGAVDAAIEITDNVKMSRGAQNMPVRHFRTAERARIRIRTESLQEMLLHRAAVGTGVLTVGYADSAGNKKINPTVDPTSSSNVSLAAREDGQTVQVYELIYEVVEESDNQTLAQALAVSNDT